MKQVNVTLLPDPMQRNRNVSEGHPERSSVERSEAALGEAKRISLHHGY